MLSSVYCFPVIVEVLSAKIVFYIYLKNKYRLANLFLFLHVFFQFYFEKAIVIIIVEMSIVLIPKNTVIYIGCNQYNEGQ
jgi:hypothetical protein